MKNQNNYTNNILIIGKVSTSIFMFLKVRETNEHNPW